MATYAIVKTGGKQYKVAVGDLVKVEKIEGAPGTAVSLAPVLVVDGSDLTTDAEKLAKISVAGEIVERLTREVIAQLREHVPFRPGAAELLTANPSLTAILALNDSMAVGTLATLRDRGIAVPAQISVTGFDDMPIARDVTPALTTVRLPLVGMGERAMALALGDDPGPLSEPAPAEIIWRSSCAAPPPL